MMTMLFNFVPRSMLASKAKESSPAARKMASPPQKSAGASPPLTNSYLLLAIKILLLIIIILLLTKLVTGASNSKDRPLGGGGKNNSCSGKDSFATQEISCSISSFYKFLLALEQTCSPIITIGQLSACHCLIQTQLT
jgi:hypothetical protein